jgi:hypothetical protein
VTRKAEPAVAGQERTCGPQEQPVTAMVPRPGDVSAEDGELVTQDGVLDLHRFAIPAPRQAEEPAKDEVEDRYEHQAAMVPMRWSAGESLFWHLSGWYAPKMPVSSQAADGR